MASTLTPGVARSREADKFVIRFLPGHRDRLKGLAQRSYRSMNSEVGTALTWWIEKKHVIEFQEEQLTKELARLRQLDSVMNHAQALDAIESEFPDTAGLVMLLKDRLTTTKA